MPKSKTAGSRVEKLEEILAKLRSEEDLKQIKEEAKEFLKSITPEELSKAEQRLIAKGLDPITLQKLCSIHMELTSLEQTQGRKQLEKGHPIDTLMQEHEIILEKLDRLAIIKEQIATANGFEELKDEIKEIKDIAHHLLEAEKHHRREEVALFPRLERMGITGPPQIMRMEHEELLKQKERLGELVTNLGEVDFKAFRAEFTELADYLVTKMRDHIFKENNILYPTALKSIPETEWEEVKKHADDIGYCCFTPQKGEQ